MHKTRLALGALVASAVIVFAGGSAHAASSSATTPDGSAWVSITTHGIQAIEVVIQDSNCDARSPVLYYKVGSQSSYSTIKNTKGCGGQVHTYPSVAAPRGTTVKYYLCNVNTSTGYRSCTGVYTLVGD